VDAHLSGNEDSDLMITVRGEIDLANAAGLLRRLIVLAHPATGEISLDLSQVSFMDCAGLHMLAAMDRHIRARGGSMRVVAASPAVARLFELVSPLVLLPNDYAPRRPPAGLTRTGPPTSKRRPPSAPSRARPR
jgi:anti-anti-sigma factor